MKKRQETRDKKQVSLPQTQRKSKKQKTKYQQTLNWMFSRLPMYQRQGKTAFKKDLTNIVAFAKHLDNPQNKFKTIHVAGTNGKGSTSHLLASILH